MIKIENEKVYGWEAAVEGMRNPLNSWDKSDSFRCKDSDKNCNENCPACGRDLWTENHHCTCGQSIDWSEN